MRIIYIYICSVADFAVKIVFLQIFKIAQKFGQRPCTWTLAKFHQKGLQENSCFL